MSVTYAADIQHGCVLHLCMQTPVLRAVVIAGLGKQETYVSTGYSLELEWQTNYSAQWDSLGCLDSLVSLKLSGSLPNLPAVWAENSSFPLLQVLYRTLLGMSSHVPAVLSA